MTLRQPYKLMTVLACKPVTSTPLIQISSTCTKYIPVYRGSRTKLINDKATAIVNDRLNANKPAQPAHDPKSGKLAPGQINNSKDLDVDVRKEDQSFFSSFFSSAKGAQAKKKTGASAMEAVSALELILLLPRAHLSFLTATSGD